jgi:hypothetical protein
MATSPPTKWVADIARLPYRIKRRICGCGRPKARRVTAAFRRSDSRGQSSETAERLFHRGRIEADRHQLSCAPHLGATLRFSSHVSLAFRTSPLRLRAGGAVETDRAADPIGTVDRRSAQRDGVRPPLARRFTRRKPNAPRKVSPRWSTSSPRAHWMRPISSSSDSPTISRRSSRSSA